MSNLPYKTILNSEIYFNKVGHILDSNSEYYDWFLEFEPAPAEKNKDLKNVKWTYLFIYNNKVTFDTFNEKDAFDSEIYSLGIDFNLIKWLTPKEVDYFVEIGKLLPSKKLF